MKYRAILITSEKLERPQQRVGNSQNHLVDWGREVLKGVKDPNARVVIYEQREEMVYEMRKE